MKMNRSKVSQVLKNAFFIADLFLKSEKMFMHFQKPLIKEINGIRLAFLAYCGDVSGECKKYRDGISHGAALLKNQTVLEDVNALKKVKV